MTVKSWNTDSSAMQADETIYIDYEDEQKTKACMIKFKTTSDRFAAWLKCHRAKYNEEYLKNDGFKCNWSKENKQMTMKKGVKNHLVIKFYPSTGVVTVQSQDMMVYLEQEFPKWKKAIDLHVNDCSVTLNQSTVNDPACTSEKNSTPDPLIQSPEANDIDET